MLVEVNAHSRKIVLYGNNEINKRRVGASFTGFFRQRCRLGQPLGADIGGGAFDGMGCGRGEIEGFFVNLARKCRQQIGRGTPERVHDFTRAVDASGGDQTIDLIHLQVVRLVYRQFRQRFIPVLAKRRLAVQPPIARFCSPPFNNIC